LSPFPFDGISIDGVPFSIANIWGAPVQIKAAGGVPGFPGIYFDDSVAYQIVGVGATGSGSTAAASSGRTGGFSGRRLTPAEWNAFLGNT
jgi:hypothetical protein